MEDDDKDVIVSDDHYRNAEKLGHGDPILMQEATIDMLINNGIPPIPAFFIATAQKYIPRAGAKPDEDWKKEIGKAINYLTRAVTGEWKPKDS